MCKQDNVGGEKGKQSVNSSNLFPHELIKNSINVKCLIGCGLKDIQKYRLRMHASTKYLPPLKVTYRSS